MPDRTHTPETTTPRRFRVLPPVRTGAVITGVLVIALCAALGISSLASDRTIVEVQVEDSGVRKNEQPAATSPAHRSQEDLASAVIASRYARNDVAHADSLIRRCVADKGGLSQCTTLPELADYGSVHFLDLATVKPSDDLEGRDRASDDLDPPVSLRLHGPRSWSVGKTVYTEGARAGGERREVATYLVKHYGKQGVTWTRARGLPPVARFCHINFAAIRKATRNRAKFRCPGSTVKTAGHGMGWTVG